MKTGEDIIKKCISLFVLVLYFFMVTTYILYLPSCTRYNGAGSAVASAPAAHLHHSNSSNNSYVQLHGAFKSVPENKRKAINLLIESAALAFLLLFSVSVLPGLIKKSTAAVIVFLYPPAHDYLRLCTLRI